MKKIIEILSSPFKKNFSYFLSLVILSSVADVGAWFLYKEPIFAVYLGLHGYLMCYVVTLIYGIIGNIYLRKAYAVVFISLALVSCFVDIVCHNTLHIGFTKDLVSIIIGTNPAESLEFANTFLSVEVFLLFVGVLLILCAIFYFRYSINKVGEKLTFLGIFVLLVGITAIYFKKSQNWEGVYLYKIKTLLSYSAPRDLKQYLKNPSIKKVNEGPKNIVMVIGESFSKHHSSLYDYEKYTNPELEKLRYDSLLFVYENVASAEFGTIVSFQCIMSTYKPEFKQEVNWYECVTLPEIISKTDYKSIWISNQSRNGVYDNVVSKYAELCDTSIWTGQKFAGIVKTDLDELVIEKLNDSDLYGGDKNCFVVHLMGSHYTFKSRYPDNYNVFKSDDYQNFKEHQRSTLAEYDNSILYNDYVVSEICKSFENKEAIVIYFPDHGLDVYNSDENYVGHPRTIDSLSVAAGREIPFMIYTSPEYQKNFPDKMHQIKTTLLKSFRTDDVLYTIMDIMGVKFADNDDVNKYSLFGN